VDCGGTPTHQSTSIPPSGGGMPPRLPVGASKRFKTESNGRVAGRWLTWLVGALRASSCFAHYPAVLVFHVKPHCTHPR